MEAIFAFLQSVLQHADLSNISIGMVLMALISAAVIKWTPNKVMYAWGQKVGRKLSAAGRKAVKAQYWEAIENNLTGTVTAFFKGIEAGADEDDSEGD